MKKKRRTYIEPKKQKGKQGRILAVCHLDMIFFVSFFVLKQEDRPIYVAVNEGDVCMGYAFCQMQEQPFSTNMVPFKSLFIDDLCVDQHARGQHIGESLFEYVKQQAKEQGCYEVTLNVWAGNTSAEHFYEKMGMKTKERQMEYIL